MTDINIKSLPRPRRWIIDVSNSVAYANWIGSCVGLQRVEFELIRKLRSHPDLLVFSTFENTYWDLTSLIRQNLEVDDFIAAAKVRHPFVGRRIRGPRAVGLTLQRWWRRRFRPPKFGAGDRLILAGAWWDLEEIYARCIKAQAAGADIVLILYDLIPLLHKDLTGHDYSNQFQRMLQLPMHVCSISKYTSEELQEAIDCNLAAPPLSLNITPLAHEFPGAARNDRSTPLSASLRERLSGRAYVLCVGTIEIRKNVARLLDAWALLRERRGDDLPMLVMAGKRGWKADETIKRLETEAGVLFVESPQDAELRALYAQCLFTVFPSFFEGWGLPIGESLWFGKACVSSRVTTMPEVGGDNCLYFDPFDIYDIADKIGQLFDDSTRITWENKIAAAHLRTWRDVGSTISEIVERV